MKNTLSIRLKELRAQNKYTQKQIADYLNITDRGYRAYELGSREPPIDSLIALANYFNVSIDYLVGRTDNPEVNK